MKNYIFMLATVFALVFSGCGGGGGGSSTADSATPPELVSISGIATDDPISNGTVIIRNLNDVELETGMTDEKGLFTIEVDSSKISTGYKLSVSGGQIGNDDFNGTLHAVYDNSQDKNQSNLTLITTLIQTLANDETGTLLEKRNKVIERLVDIGMIQNSDWFNENPDGLDLVALQSEVRSKGLSNWLNSMKSDLSDNKLNIDNNRIFTRAYKGMNKITVSSSILSIFPGQTLQLFVDGEFLDDNETNISVTKVSGPSWVTIENTTIRIAPPETETNFGNYTLTIEVIPEGMTKGRTKDITISLLKAVVLVEGTLDENGGRIENQWKDIAISVDAGKLSQTYDITYYGGINENNEISLWLTTVPDMNDSEKFQLNVNKPSYEAIKTNYLINDESIERSLRKKVLNRNLTGDYGEIDHNYSQYASNSVPQECKPGTINGKLNEMVWTDENKDGVYFPYVWQGTTATFNLDYAGKDLDYLAGLASAGIGGPLRVQKPKEDLVSSPDVMCASALRSLTKEGDTSITGKEAILFVHGFINTGKLGGYDQGGGKFGGEYFAKFPQLVKDYTIDGKTVIPFIFQWRTNAKFEDVASELGSAVEQLKSVTGNKVHIVAHSFGGILSRTLAQGLSSNSYYDKSFAENSIASITTVGTPHSGTFGSNSSRNFDGEGEVVFPEGRNGVAGALIENCIAITCHQTGSQAMNMGDIILNEDIYGWKRETGYITYKLFQELDNYPNIPTQNLIGLVPESRTISKQDNGLYSIDYDFLNDKAFKNPGVGDKLISVFGQRVIPDGDQNDLNEVYNANNIEEHILHMDARSNSFIRGKDDDLMSLYTAGALVNNDWTKEDYATNIEKEDLTNFMFGYNHRTGQYQRLRWTNKRAELVLGGLNIEDDYQKYDYTIRNSEVGLHNCDSNQNCNHPTWNYFTTFLGDKLGQTVPETAKIYVSGKVLQDGRVPEEPYIVRVLVQNEDEGGLLAVETITGTSDYNISVNFRPQTENTKYYYYVQVSPEQGSNLRGGISNKIATDITVEESDLSFNDILLVDTEYKTSEISITLKDAIDNIALSDYNITIYNGINPIINGHTDDATYSTIVGLGDYTCVATKTGYKQSTPIPCYSKKDEVTSYEISIYRDEAVGTARRIRVLADHITPWDTSAFTEIMDANGYTEGVFNGQYSVIPSSKISSTDFIVGKDLIIIMNDQDQNYYNNLAQNMSKIDNFVKNGGVALFEVSDRGWSRGKLSTAGITQLPGGVTFEYNYDSTNINVNVDATLMSGVSETVEGNSASHESFDNLPDGTTVYTTDNNGKATLIEYKYGLGWIIATGQPLEHGYENGNSMGLIYPNLYNYVLGNISQIQNRSINRSLKKRGTIIPSHK